MKHGSKVASRATTTAGSSLPQASPAIAIPYPPGLSAIVAEEVQSIPHFTPREKDVGGWIAEGKTDAEIASILGRAVETVKTHVKSLLEKTGCDNRNAFIAWTWRNRMAIELGQARRRKKVKYR